MDAIRSSASGGDVHKAGDELQRRLPPNALLRRKTGA
jgi:hypothetical protein